MATAEQTSMAYDDPHTPLHPKKPLESLLKKFASREKKLPKSSIPLTRRNLEEFHNPDYTEIHDAFLGVRPQRKVSVPKWLQLLPRVRLSSFSSLITPTNT